MIIHLPNEELISSIDANRLMLTNKRLMCYDNKNYQVIRLEHIRFIEYKIKRFPRILIATLFISLAIFIASKFENRGDNDGAPIAFIAACIGIVTYFMFVKKTLRIATSAGSINLNTQGIGKADIETFIEHVEKAI
jgi:hypothetical protein